MTSRHVPLASCAHSRVDQSAGPIQTKPELASPAARAGRITSGRPVVLYPCSVNANSAPMSVDRFRPLLLGTGLAVLSALALILYLRRVDTVEVLASLFFIPVFVAFLFWGMRGGIVVGLLAAVGYVGLRLPAIDAVGAGRFVGLIAGRAGGYLAFGFLGGWAAQRLTSSMAKLEQVDDVEDATGLLNARALVEEIGLERSRSRRYGKSFSIAVAELPAGVVLRLPKRDRESVLEALGEALRTSVRSVDQAGFGRHEGRMFAAVILPETEASGAIVFATNLQERIRTVLADHGIGLDKVTTTLATYPKDETAVQAVADHFAEIARMEFPPKRS